MVALGHPAILRPMRHALLVAAALAAALLPAQQAPVPLAVTGLDKAAPLKMTATLDGLQLKVQIALDAGWHLYGRDTGGGQPVRVELEPGSAFAAAGPLQVPMDAKGEITGKAELVLPLRRTGAHPGLLARCSFVTCDALECLPPMDVQFSNQPNVLLVAVGRGERADRIAAFLTSRGFHTTTTTYDEVQLAQCDASDLVIADSPTFDDLGARTGQRAAADAAARRFPLTSAPLICIGFLGTELLKAQKVSMASGYV
jgi:hypothetical protein